jgi:hypothetical protein
MVFPSISSLVAIGAILISGAQAIPVHYNASTVPFIPNGHWVDTWTAMPQLTEYGNLPLPPFVSLEARGVLRWLTQFKNQTNLTFPNTTIRQTLHMSIGANQIRIRISNAFGGADLPITAVTVALPFNGSAGTSAVQVDTLQTLTFSGNQSIIIPDQSLAVSDPINFTIEPQSMLAVTMYLADGQATNYITSHPGSRTTSWYAFGNEVNAANLTVTNASLQSAAHW